MDNYLINHFTLFIRCALERVNVLSTVAQKWKENCNSTHYEEIDVVKWSYSRCPLYFFSLDLVDQIKWHFNTVARTLLEMSACQPPPCRPSLSAVDVFISLCVNRHACTVCGNIYTAGLRLQGNSRKRKHEHNYRNSSDFIGCFVSSCFMSCSHSFSFKKREWEREREKKIENSILFAVFFCPFSHFFLFVHESISYSIYNYNIIVTISSANMSFNSSFDEIQPSLKLVLFYSTH